MVVSWKFCRCLKLLQHPNNVEILTFLNSFSKLWLRFWSNFKKLSALGSVQKWLSNHFVVQEFGIFKNFFWNFEFCNKSKYFLNILKFLAHKILPSRFFLNAQHNKNYDSCKRQSGWNNPHLTSSSRANRDLCYQLTIHSCFDFHRVLKL